MAAGPRRRRIGGHELVEQLNAVVAQLIKENRKLKRQVEKLTARGTRAASGTVDRSLRAIQKRAQKALAAPVKRRKRRVASTAAKKTTRRTRTPKTPA
jgi:cell division septum initiation protein DivIVA